jgi:hypothetical protein
VRKRRQGREVYISLDTGHYRAVLAQLGALVAGAVDETPPEGPAASADGAATLRGR